MITGINNNNTNDTNTLLCWSTLSSHYVMLLFSMEWKWLNLITIKEVNITYIERTAVILKKRIQLNICSSMVVTFHTQCYHTSY